MPDYLASQLLLDQLVAEETRYVFGTPGITAAALLQALHARSDIHYVQGLHEAIAVSMAMGYAQVSGKPGVISLNISSGLSNALSAIANASKSRIPLILLVGQYDTRILNEIQPSEESMQEMAAPFCKWSLELKTAEELPRMLRRAFYEALSPPMGPTLVSLPVNIMNRPVSVRMLLPQRTTPLGVADNSFIKRAGQLLLSAKHPAIIAGNEIWQYHARKEMVALAEVLGCPVFSEHLPTGCNFPNRHPLFAGLLPTNQEEANESLSANDVILICGMQNRTPLDFHPQSLIPPSAVVIQINMEGGLTGRTLPCHFGANADLGETISKLRSEIQLLADTQWANNARIRSRDTSSSINDGRRHELTEILEGKASCSYPLQLFSILEQLKPEKSVLVNDLTWQNINPCELMSLDGNSNYFASNGSASGYALAAALGAQWASRETTVICLTDDRSLLCYPQALWTAAHYGLGIKVIVFNSQGATLPDGGIPPSGIKDPTVCLPVLASSMGVASQSISAGDEVQAALKRLFACQGPCLLEVQI